MLQWLEATKCAAVYQLAPILIQKKQRSKKRYRADYDDVVEMREGEAIVSFERDIIQANIFYSNPGHAQAMRVTRYAVLPDADKQIVKHAEEITVLRDKLG